ncbi:hypothetical protein Q757_07890 [Oenococcus alcoholitolerans]|uniref:Uncharacterized protein n=1 Tax=Oenococcus alcoholitolerans TaxID=931074 RepID=A0ABR4XPR5_9LACO|nr:hypothetical protein Q757_07890 [Oenococcus alcoholitolerans]
MPKDLRDHAQVIVNDDWQLTQQTADDYVTKLIYK